MDGGVTPLLEFVKQSEGKKDDALLKVITDALSHPDVFVFSELLFAPTVQAFAKSRPKHPVICTLELFCFRTYKDYLLTPKEFITLTPEMDKKLRVLSLISLCRGENVSLFVIIFLSISPFTASPLVFL
jgi:COP9 signalosome complex subunit 7